MKGKTIERLKNNFLERRFTTDQAKSIGVSPRMLSYAVKMGQIERVGRGHYIFSDFNVDKDFQFADLALKAASYKESVICLVSALNYWELTDEIAKQFWLAFPNNYPVPKKAEMVRVYRPRNLKTGVIEKVISGLRVKITDPERSIVDTFKNLDTESAITSLRYYLGQDEDKVKIGKLLEMATKLKARNLIKLLENITIAQAQDYPSLNAKIFKQSTQWLSNKKKEAK